MRFPTPCRTLATAILLGSLGCSAPGTDPPSQPDIILVSVDSLRPDHLGCYGYPRPTSPTIDALAGRGVLFRTATSSTSWTLPAHAALFTGLNDPAHGTTDLGFRLAEPYVTLTETLRAAGYQTAGFYGGPLLHPAFGFAQGFETYTSCMSSSPGDDPERVLDDFEALAAASHADVTGPRTLERVSAWLDTTDERPLFLFVHLWDVHYDYVPPPQYLRRFEAAYEGRLDPHDYIHNDAINADLDPADLRHILALYDGEIAFTDNILGRILDLLAERDRPDQTLTLVTADHGEEFFEHGGKGHQKTLFDESTRIPLVVAWPGRLPAGLISHTAARIVDVMPTILGLVGLVPETPVQGRDLSPSLFGGRQQPVTAFSELSVQGFRLRAVRRDPLKVLQAGEGLLAYLDLEQDPSEQELLRPLSPAARDLSRELEAITAESDELRHQIAGKASRAAAPNGAVMERLKALGYLD